MTAALKNEITTREAQKLWGLLRQHFINFERTLEEIVEKRAWDPMGYASFPEAWTAQMGDVTLAAEFRPHVVYAYFDAGASVDDVAAGVKGIGRDRAESLDRQRRNGVPAGHASLGGKWHNKDSDTTIVREHERKKPSESSMLHLHLGVLKRKRVERAAGKLGLSAQEYALLAIDEKLKA